MVVSNEESVILMTLRRRIKILVNELKRKRKNIAIAEIHYIKIGDGKWETVGSEYELYERLMQEWEES